MLQEKCTNKIISQKLLKEKEIKQMINRENNGTNK